MRCRGGAARAARRGRRSGAATRHSCTRRPLAPHDLRVVPGRKWVEKVLWRARQHALLPPAAIPARPARCVSSRAAERGAAGRAGRAGRGRHRTTWKTGKPGTTCPGARSTSPRVASRSTLPPGHDQRELRTACRCSRAVTAREGAGQGGAHRTHSLMQRRPRRGSSSQRSCPRDRSGTWKVM